MGNYINRKTLIDSETGEILKQQEWLGYDGFSDAGYRYRPRCEHIRYFFDSMTDNLDIDSWTLLFLIAELMNTENVLIYRVKRKSKFSNIVYKPMSKEDIRYKLRYKYGQNKFDKCWRTLCKKIIKKVKYYDVMVWAVDPSVISKCRDIPYWLYEAFQESINAHISATAIKKFQQKLDNYDLQQEEVIF